MTEWRLEDMARARSDVYIPRLCVLLHCQGRELGAPPVFLYVDITARLLESLYYIHKYRELCITQTLKTYSGGSAKYLGTLDGWKCILAARVAFP
jgi:hypothetical protein